MLIDYFNEQTFDRVYPGGYRHSDAFAPVKRRLAQAEVYELGRDASAMCAHVSLSKPSSIIAALPFVRLPATRVWIEFENIYLREAMAGMGSPNLRPREAPTVTTIERAGFLLSEAEGGFDVEYIHRDRVGELRVADMSAILGRFSLAEISVPRPADALVPPSGETLRSATGRMREYLTTLAKAPDEAVAEDALRSRLNWIAHPDMARVISSFPAAEASRIMSANASEAERLFFLQILPALILINCRNAVAIEPEPAPEKLNRARVKRGKPALRDRNVVRLKLTAGQRRVADAKGPAGREEARAAIVTGHFKVRRTGIFWWHLHLRSGKGEPVRRVRQIVP